MVVLTILPEGDASQQIIPFEFPKIIQLMTVMVKTYILKIAKLLVWSQLSTDPEFGT